MTVLYQHSTLGALMARQMAGTTTAHDLLTHGDTGIGTLHGVNGEVIILDGQMYHAQEDGSVHHVTDTENTTLPFATVHFSESGQALSLPSADFNSLATLADEFHFHNNFASIRLHGDFSHVLVRIAPKSEAPYPSLATVAANQPTFTAENISGTIVGYYSPELYQGAVAAGWHLHFLSDDQTFGGHLLAIEGTNLTGKLEEFSDFQLHLPIDNADFKNHTLELDGLNEGIAAAEGH
ncbi:acetolactate decarboxylase [Weissella ceti]|uniref:Alpha-acetolactate decarboxylase n=1 Tax=Weissella ceti TaxID=759620 RepID=A0ABT3E5T2_9LACO|nr:acetolactate decarboxylase [Weissella ceti]MCW0953774.1 acetolactate decarboxylase [Weissella ceti]QVK11860.1 acetolactate decarboxylase [Weissella ceti]